MPDLSGVSIGRYHIIEQLGEGGMAVVYRAFDTTLECDVALKVIRMDRLADDQMEKIRLRFKIEAQKTAQLLHPNIVPVTDYGEIDGTPYLVMRYIPGGQTLKSRLGKPLPYQEAIRLIIPISRALEVAHAHHLVHRDVKPANILITTEGSPMLTDFGIAKVVESEPATDSLTQTGMALGTPFYMAPEQWEGKPVDGRADVYALGVVLYEMITGRPPFKADTVPATMVQVLRDPLPRPSMFIPGLPDYVEQLLFKALARDPNHRFPSMLEFTRAMQTVLDYRGGRSASVVAEPAAQSTSLDTMIEIQDPLSTVVEPGGYLPVADHQEPIRAKKKRLPIFLGLGIAAVVGLVFIGKTLMTGGNPLSYETDTASTKAPLNKPTNSLSSDAISVAAAPSEALIITPSFAEAATATEEIQLMATPFLHAVDGCKAKSHLQVGDLAFVSLDHGFNGIRTEADTTVSNVIDRAYNGDIVLIIDGPVCDVGEYLLWKVKPAYPAAWDEGWTPEVAYSINEYWLAPIPSWQACAGSLPSHLNVGDTAYVSAIDDSSNRVRSEPGLDNERIGSIEVGVTMAILDGPECADDMVWWYVQSAQNLVGWTSEGNSSEYWLVPQIGD